MGLITEESLYEDVEFKCPRCKAEVSRTSRLEESKGYVSDEGEFVGLCDKCYGELPDKMRVVVPVLETAFTIGIKSNGEGIVFTTDDIKMDFKRTPTPFDIKGACTQIMSEIQTSDVTIRMLGLIQQIQQNQQPNSKIVLPRKR